MSNAFKLVLSWVAFGTAWVAGACADEEGVPEAEVADFETDRGSEPCMEAYEALVCPEGSFPRIVEEDAGSLTIVDLDNPDVLLPLPPYLRALRPEIVADRVGYQVREYGSCAVYCESECQITDTIAECSVNVDGVFCGYCGPVADTEHCRGIIEACTK